MPRHPISEQKEARIVALIREGLTYKVISERMGEGVSTSVVGNIAEKYGMKYAHRKPTMAKDTEDKIIELLRDGVKPPIVAERLSLPKQDIYNVMKRKGLTLSDSEKYWGITRRRRRAQS